MDVNICERTSFELVRRLFSEELYSKIKVFAERNGGVSSVEEIRLRRNRDVYLTLGAYGGKRNLSLGTRISADELSKIFNEACGGSLYAYSETIAKGYITLPEGIRIGVCGHAAVENGRIIGVYDISALNIRLPRYDIRADRKIETLVRRNIRVGKGTLIFSPPSGGKTTCLRSLAYALSSGDAPLRVAVVDTRGELSFFPNDSKMSVDVLTGYPKAEGIRIATLFMNPEVIICDEIGGEDEARSIVDAENCGVPLIATAHGDSISSLMRKRGILALHEAYAFGTYISIRIGNGGAFDTVAYGREEAFLLDADNRLAHNSA
ncbi:MAG: Flp pilus assembly complex ATPase component TadA [Clostridia bacterium]|nr:Flp pilus assembly complex ATPase component TadA [Clostridia bacterium]